MRGGPGNPGVLHPTAQLQPGSPRQCAWGGSMGGISSSTPGTPSRPGCQAPRRLDLPRPAWSLSGQAALCAFAQEAWAATATAWELKSEQQS